MNQNNKLKKFFKLDEKYDNSIKEGAKGHYEDLNLFLIPFFEDYIEIKDLFCINDYIIYKKSINKSNYIDIKYHIYYDLLKFMNKCEKYGIKQTLII